MTLFALGCLAFAAGFDALIIALAWPSVPRPVGPRWPALTAAGAVVAFAAAFEAARADHITAALTLAGAGQAIAGTCILLLRAAEGGGGGGGGGGGPGPDDEPPAPSSPGADWDSFEADFWRHVERDRVQGSKR